MVVMVVVVGEEKEFRELAMSDIFTFKLPELKREKDDNGRVRGRVCREDKTRDACEGKRRETEAMIRGQVRR